MASSINASTSGAGGVITTADSSGILNLQSGGVTVATINSTGIVMASNTAPAFSAYASATQSLTTSTFTKIQANIKEFDTNSNYDTTNYRFTPTIAGYYQFSGGCAFSTTQTSELLLTLYRNGARYKTLFDMEATSWAGYGTALVYANGSTDYFELYVYSSSTGTKTTVGNARDTYFSGCFVRSA